MNCELCGKEGKLFRVKIESSLFRVCRGCSKFGRRDFVPFTPEGKVSSREEIKESPKKVLHQEEEKMEVVVNNFNEILRKEREKRNLTQEEVGKKINERESVMRKLEKKQMEPSLELARKLEKFFGVELIKEESGKVEDLEKEERKGLTMGDLLGK